MDTVFLRSLLRTNAAVHLKVSMNLLAAETFQPNRNQSDCAYQLHEYYLAQVAPATYTSHTVATPGLLYQN